MGTPCGRSFQEGVTILFAPANSRKLSEIQGIKISKFLDSVAPGAVKEVRINKFRNLVAIDAWTPRLKGVLLRLNMLCSTPVRTFLPRPANLSVKLTRGGDLDLSDDEIMNLITYPAQVQHMSSALVRIHPSSRYFSEVQIRKDWLCFLPGVFFQGTCVAMP